MKTYESKLLYVDDHEGNTLMFKNIFEGNHTIFTATSGEEGLALMAMHQINLVVANHNMPQICGLKFLERARLQRPDLKSILLMPNTDFGILGPVTKDITVIGYTNNPFDLMETKLLIDWAIELSLGEIQRLRSSKAMGTIPNTLPTTAVSTTKVIIRFNNEGIIEMRSPAYNDRLDKSKKGRIKKYTIDNFVGKEDGKTLRKKIREIGICPN